MKYKITNTQNQTLSTTHNYLRALTIAGELSIKNSNENSNEKYFISPIFYSSGKGDN